MSTLLVPAPRASGVRASPGLPTRSGQHPVRSTAPTQALHRLLGSVDARLVSTLVAPVAAAEAAELRLRLAVLLRLRHGLAAQWAMLGNDVALNETLTEYLEGVPGLMADLETGGVARLRRILDYCRELLSELRALGADPARCQTFRAQLLQLRQSSAQAAPAAVAASADLARAMGAALASLDDRATDSLLAQLLRS